MGKIFHLLYQCQWTVIFACAVCENIKVKGITLVVILVGPLVGSLLLVMVIVTGDERRSNVMCVEGVRE